MKEIWEMSLWILKKHWYLAPAGTLLIVWNIIRVIYSIVNYSNIEHPIVNILYGLFIIFIFIPMYIFFVFEYLHDTGKIDENGNFKDQS